MKGAALPWRVLGALSLSVFVQFGQPAFCGEQPTIVILPFDFKKKSSTGVDVGRQMAVLLGLKLRALGNYNVVQAPPDDLLQSSSDQHGNVIGLMSVGRRLNANAVLIGTVQDFDLVMNTGSSGGKAVVSAARAAAHHAPYGAGAIASILGSVSSNMENRGKVRTLLEVKLIDVVSGGTILGFGGAGESKRSTSTLWNYKQNFADFTSESFASTAAGEAANSAIEPICAQLDAATSRVAALAESYKVLGAVSDIDDSIVCVDAGKNLGLAVGDNLSIDRPTIAHGAVGKLQVGIGISVPVGQIVLTGVGEKSAIGNFSGNLGTAPPQVGDYFRKARTAEAVTLQTKPIENTPSPNARTMSVQGVLAPPGSDSGGSEVSDEVVPSVRSHYKHTVPGSAPLGASNLWERFFDSGIKFYNRGSYAGARAMFNVALKRNPPPEVVSQIETYLREIERHGH